MKMVSLICEIQRTQTQNSVFNVPVEDRNVVGLDQETGVILECESGYTDITCTVERCRVLVWQVSARRFSPLQ
jgi:hypothetical protein